MLIAVHVGSGTWCLILGLSSHFSFEEIRSFVLKHRLEVVGATLGNDERSVGLHEIMDIEHGGLEKYGFECLNIGTSVMPEKLIDVAIEYGACAILASLIVSHQQIHHINMQKLVDIAIEKGVRDRFLFIAGGSHLDHELALECGLDSGFDPGTRGEHVAQFITSRLLSLTQEIDGNS
jgi:D-ornithine 4,5-aminomutase subunit beta